MDQVGKKFDVWAKNGKAEQMEIEHKKTVLKFLKTIQFDRPFVFLDVGCGNGWVLRVIVKEKNCKKAIGIDKSKKMIMQAKSKKTSNKEEFVYADIETFKYKEKLDIIFSMESLYYAESVEIALRKIYILLKTGGQFICGTDFYKDNKTTARWSKMMNLKMHLYSKKQWREIFKDAGFSVKTKQVKDPNDRKKWRREFGTLFIIGTK